MTKTLISAAIATGLLISVRAVWTSAQGQAPNTFSEMRWRSIGPTRAGRARALSGVRSQPNVFYIGFDNGGVWRSTDYGSTWTPLFDSQPTGSIGAIAVAASDPNVIYVGSGAGIIRPDLAVGDGVYKSTDAGKTWTHLPALRDTAMIANIEVDPRNPNRLFVAALGHPYGPNAERGIFRSTDGGRTFEKVLYRNEYVSADDVRIDPSEPNTVYAALWQQQQSYIEGGGFGGTAAQNDGGIFKSTDGGSTWRQLSNGLPNVLQANLAIAMSNPKVLYAAIACIGGCPINPPAGGAGGGAGAAGAGAGGGGRGGGGGNPQVAFYKTNDGGEHWFLATDDPRIAEKQSTRIPQDQRPTGRIGGGDLPTLTIDPKNENVVYSCSTVFWRTEDGGATWSAVRGAPGGDDYQKAWINPDNPNIILAVADQGGVVSANRGESWSNWYTQPTGAMYHVTADNAFPYRLCGGQQDSGSACVDSRSNDGQITFHDWHPVNIQEYGIAAPDPKDPDLVFGSQRTGVSLYNRRTGQTQSVGPPADVRGAFGRNVRTMPILWSPADPTVLFYASNAVFKTTNHGHSWTRISGDLTRQTWAVPASVGKYAAGVTPSPQGSITSLAASPRSVNILWAGTDDGNIQVTIDGGATWRDVTPAAIKPWTRIFNMDAGHFDALTAYAAANTLRLDDMNPHFFRTHDGGKTWTEINTGIAPGAVSNSIREDPRVKGLLYAATDTQVWVSFDDGDHWSSLRQNMPAISVRDIKIKDDDSCLCADLVAGTHGRGFWILDDVTPLRQQAALQAARGPFLYKPVTGIRVRFAMNDPTPWPPELPAGENPPPGALIDYYLPAAATGEVRLEILNSQNRVIRSYSSNDPVRDPDPARDPVAYNKVCQANPGAPDCGVPLYWPAPQQLLSKDAGHHRFWWDMHYDPLVGGGGGRGGGGNAVPHRTYPAVASPWVAPGTYTVRLTADGRTLTQPIVVKLDPRVKVTPAIQQIFALTTQAENNAAAAASIAAEIHAAAGRLRAKPQSAANDALIKELDALAPPATAGGGEPSAGRGAGGGRGGGRGGGGGGRGGAAGAAPAAPTANFNTIGAAMVQAVMGLQGSEMAPTAAQLKPCTDRLNEYAALVLKWNAVKLKLR
ncbi:MAG TPA: hypothetical protein VFV78_08680 [Vicinamibacterales bacterium]|nr:hypothetical protein [Vicinamibacterales bacterium]